VGAQLFWGKIEKNENFGGAGRRPQN